MGAEWQAGSVALLCVLVCVPILQLICRRWNFYDSAGPLKIHSGPISRLGGIGIGLGIVTGAILGDHGLRQHFGLWLLAFGVVWLAGFLDDTRGLSPFLRLAAQVVAGITLWAAGWRLPFAAPAWLGVAAICLTVVLFVNSFNFLDGSDGLSAGVGAVIAATYILAYGSGSGTKGLGFTTAWCLLGVCLGFLVFNFPPASIFMGDSGSTILGFCAAFLGIDFITQSASYLGTTKWIFPVLIAAVPVVDGITVILRRLGRGHSPLRGDRRHYYDLLLTRGWSPRQVALGSYLLTGLLSVTSLWMIQAGLKSTGIALSAVIAGIVAAGIARGE